MLLSTENHERLEVHSSSAGQLDERPIGRL
jgi:hypothetical protein